jgi:hypothetical protein
MAIVRARSGGTEHDKLVPPISTVTSAPIPKEIVIEIGTPHEPSAGWRCGTDLVWPVLRIVQPAGIVIESKNPVVCRHEIEAGD